MASTITVTIEEPHVSFFFFVLYCIDFLSYSVRFGGGSVQNEFNANSLTRICVTLRSISDPFETTRRNLLYEPIGTYRIITYKPLDIEIIKL